MLKTVRVCFIVASLMGASLAQPYPHSMHGTVHDQTGAAVRHARVEIRAGDYRRSTLTADDGGFTFEEVPGEGVTVTVEFPGFTRYERLLTAGEPSLDVVLKPAPISQEINVTANRSEIGMSDTAESVSLLSRQNLDSAAAVTIDDVLREIPGFTLFRRTSSRTANPTSQGVSLRGIGASGASRALVVYNGIPMNDPFGGWVYWGRVPREGVKSVEVLRGGGSSLYGSSALGGVVNILPWREERNLASFEGSAGAMGTVDFSAMDSWQAGQWTIESAGAVFRTAGYIPVSSGQRGTVDSPADSLHQAVQSSVWRKLHTGSLFAAMDLYNESRDNGTQIQINDTQLWEIAGGANLLTQIGSFQIRGYGQGQSFNQTFSSIAANRNTELLVNAQHVPAQRAGGSLLWAWQGGSRNSLVGGADSNAITGFSNETTFAAGKPTSHLSVGGKQLAAGAFLQDVIRPASRLLLTLGGRYDNWDNYEAHSQTAPLIPSIRPDFTLFPDESEHAFSPRGALLFTATPHLTLTASAYKSFRAPTLNELYRSFRLGNTVTQANSHLRAERLQGSEFGINLFLRRTRIHATYFWMEVTDPIANVTINTTPVLITNQRQNLGRTRSQGVEFDSEFHFRRVDISAGYQFVDATVLRFPADHRLEGLQLPQVAPHQFTAQARYLITHGWTIALQGRASSSQFEDDLNRSTLDAFLQLDAYVSKRLHRGLDTFVAVENLSNSRIVLGRTPVPSVGPPISARVGFRMRFE